MCNTQNSLLLNQHNRDDAPQDYTVSKPKNCNLHFYSYKDPNLVVS